MDADQPHKNTIYNLEQTGLDNMELAGDLERTIFMHFKIQILNQTCIRLLLSLKYKLSVCNGGGVLAHL